jgi:hypothetical protein
MHVALLFLALLSVWLARPLTAQTWRTALTATAVGSLWVDYSQIRYGLSHGSPTWVLGHQLTRTSLAVVNGLEVLANVATPRKCRAWINAITLGFHVVVIYKTARRPIGVLASPGSDQIARIGLRVWW